MNNSVFHQKMRRLASGDAAVSLAMIAVALVFLLHLMPEYIVEPRRLQSPLLSPQILPQIMGWMVLLLSILLLLSTLFGRERERPPGITPLRELPVRQWLLPVLAFVVYYFGFEALGAPLCGVLATVLLFLSMGVKRVSIYALGIVMPVAICLAFDYGLSVPLPYGYLWGY